MPKVTDISIEGMFYAVIDLFNNLGIDYAIDYTLDSNMNITGRYLYGYVTEDNPARILFNKRMWYVKIDGGVNFCYCDSISFYNSYDQYGNFKGRYVSIGGTVVLYSHLISTEYPHIYSYNAGGIATWRSMYIINYSNSPAFRIDTLSVLGNGVCTDTHFIGQKALWIRHDGVRELDAYYAYRSVSYYHPYVVNINGKYYFQVAASAGDLYEHLWFPGDGTEGTLITPEIHILPLYEEIGLSTEISKESFKENAEQVDEIVSEIIRESPELLPNTGQAVLEKSKRVISKMTFE